MMNAEYHVLYLEASDNEEYPQFSIRLEEWKNEKGDVRFVQVEKHGKGAPYCAVNHAAKAQAVRAAIARFDELVKQHEPRVDVNGQRYDAAGYPTYTQL